jgi:hypothetical protein
VIEERRARKPWWMAAALLAFTAPAAAAFPAPPGPLAAIARLAALRAAPEPIVSQRSAEAIGGPLEAVIRAGMAAALAAGEPDELTEEGAADEWAEEEPQDGPGEAIDVEDGAEVAAEPDDAPEPRSFAVSDYVVAAGWCAMYSDEPEPDQVGCDIGVGAALARRGRAFLAAVIGAETVGIGLGWTAYRGGAVTIAAALGVIAPYDERGIRLDGWAPAVGTTIGFGGR